MALYPNCHNKMHIVNDFEDVERFQQKASKMI